MHHRDADFPRWRNGKPRLTSTRAHEQIRDAEVRGGVIVHGLRADQAVHVRRAEIASALPRRRMAGKDLAMTEKRWFML
ncbi:MAG: hypothetical protein MUO33_04330 [Sedimentisphaerales bacterium]|nr:hypothetical protein [Sedimentisphaerales bacterium]